jgi:hypothetical protein
MKEIEEAIANMMTRINVSYGFCFNKNIRESGLYFKIGMNMKS